jgi:hypothetical protein
MGSSSSAQRLDISIASEHCRSSSTSRADLNSPGPAYGCSGSTPASLGRHSAFSGRHIYVPADICGAGSTPTFPRPAYMFSGRIIRQRSGIYQIWPSLAGIHVCWAGIAIFWPAWASISKIRRWPGHLRPGGLASASSRPAHPRLPAAAQPGGSAYSPL